MDVDVQTRKKMKSQTDRYVAVGQKVRDKGRDGLSSMASIHPGRNRLGLTPVYLRGPSALT